MRPVLCLLPLALAVALGTPVQPAGTASPRPVPVVATWFSNLHPRVGQRETVYVQFFEGKRYLSGARLAATVRVGKRDLLRLHGTTTNKQGKAWVRFTVPRQAKGKWMWAMTRVTYKKVDYRGNNRVKVA